MTITERIHRIAVAIEGREGDYDEEVTDLLADLRHYCDYMDVDFHRALDFSYDHYSAEIREDAS